jgi:hypothetical protein
MKKEQSSTSQMIKTKTMQQGGGQKKSEDDIVMNLILLYKEFHAIGLPDVLNDILFKELRALTGEAYVLAFDTAVGRLPVKGRVYLEANGADGLYVTSYYELFLGGLPDKGGMRNAFLCTPFCLITIEEAVNLLQGRCIFRKPEVDPIGEGYWVFLGTTELMPGFRRPLLVRNGFRVREYLAETGLGSWLGVEGWNKLVHALEKGDRCDLTLGTAKGMRAVKVEADPLRQQLKVMNAKGVDVQIKG